MIKKAAVVRSSKTYRGQKKQEDMCSRVGSSFQAEIPDYIGKISNVDAKKSTPNEFSVWMPSLLPNVHELNSYLEFAKQHQYTQELALTLLHWHNYDISNAVDDIPNYAPAYNKWTKSEVKKFLRCIDSKPRKNFVEAKKTVPGRHMGDICALYYSIAAPFKARTRNKYHNELIEQCFSRAVRTGVVTCRWGKRSSGGGSQNNYRRSGLAEDPLECEVESYLVNLIGASKTTHLLGKELMSTPYPIPSSITPNSPPKSVQNCSSTSPLRCPSVPVGRENESSPASLPLSTNTYQTSSSEASSQIGSESVCRAKSNRHILPNGAYYDHEEFMIFLSMSNDQLLLEKEAKLADLQRTNEELCEKIEITEARSRSVLYRMELLRPAEGFPQISYRWTKTELAFVLTAMTKYGYDFATIARTVGTKSESFIRDFYNRFRDRFTLDIIMKSSSKTEEKSTHPPFINQKIICQEPLVVLTQDQVDMNKILTDRTSIHVNETTGELPLTVSQMNDDDVDRKLKIECDESDQLESQIQNTLHDRETESNKLRPSSRRCTASSKFLTPKFLSHKHHTTKSRSPSPPTQRSNNGRGRAKRLRRS